MIKYWGSLGPFGMNEDHRIMRADRSSLSN
jgi:hypothetical protein